MSDLIRKTYALGVGQVERIERIVDSAAEQDLKMSESVVVRLALAKGLPLVSESLGLEVITPDDRPEAADV